MSDYTVVNIVTAYEPVRRLVTDDVYDNLNIAVGGRWQWLQRWAANWLKRMGALNLRCVSKWTQPTWKQIPTYPLIKHIKKQRLVCELLWDGDLDRIVIGHDLMAELLHEVAAMHPFSFEVNIDLYNSGSYQVYGLRVQYVPWMTGLLVLPKERV